MDRTLFAGLTRLEPGESLQSDNGSFQSENPETIDRFLEIGAVTHRHDAHAAQANPIIAPSASAVASGGHIPGGTALVFGYTLLDDEAGETTLSPLVTVTTDPPLDPPSAPPLGVIDYTAGDLLTDTYYYAVSLTDGEGGETPIGEPVAVEREPGFANGQVLISDLAAIMEESGASGWRLWRAQGGADYFLIATGADDEFIDTGVDSIDATVAPLVDTENFTNSDNSVWVVVPDSAEMVTASAFALYMSQSSDFGGPSMVGTYPLGSAGAEIWVRDLDVGTERPPDVSTCVPGASKIDPDVELLDWPWKRPVATFDDLPATTEREIRLVLDQRLIFEADPGATGPSDWTPLAFSDLEQLLGDLDSEADGPFDRLRFAGAGGAVVTVSGPFGDVPPYEGDILITTPSGTVHQVAGSGASGTGLVENPESIVFMGAGVTVDVAASGASAIVTITDPGPAREDVVFGASALASGAAAALDHPIYKGYRLLRVQSSRACRLRAYPNSTYRTADAARAIGVAPTGDHGLLLETLLPTGDLDYAIAPALELYNLDGPPATTAYFALTNMDALGDVAITLTLVQTE